MSTKSIRCHPDAIRCPSLWQRAVRKKERPGLLPALADFYFLASTYLWEVLLGGDRMPLPPGQELLAPRPTDRRQCFGPWKYGIGELGGALARLETSNHRAQCSPWICFIW